MCKSSSFRIIYPLRFNKKSIHISILCMITCSMPFSTSLESLDRMFIVHAEFLSVLHFTHNNLSFFWNSLLFTHLQIISLWNTADSCYVCMLIYHWLMLYIHALLLTPICACFTADSYCVCMLYCWLILCVHALLKHWNSGRWSYNTLHNKNEPPQTRQQTPCRKV